MARKDLHAAFSPSPSFEAWVEEGRSVPVEALEASGLEETGASSVGDVVGDVVAGAAAGTVVEAAAEVVAGVIADVAVPEIETETETATEAVIGGAGIGIETGGAVRPRQ